MGLSCPLIASRPRCDAIGTRAASSRSGSAARLCSPLSPRTFAYRVCTCAISSNMPGPWSSSAVALLLAFLSAAAAAAIGRRGAGRRRRRQRHWSYRHCRVCSIQLLQSNVLLVCRLDCPLLLLSAGPAAWELDGWQRTGRIVHFLGSGFLACASLPHCSRSRRHVDRDTV